MRVLVTGANGYLGTGIVNELIDHGHAVYATDYVLDRVNGSAKKIQADLFEVDDPYNYFQQPEVLLHLAWQDGFKHDSVKHIENLPKHYKFLMDMIQAGIGQVCVMGSMHEAGFVEGCINEATPTNPLSLYGISKNALRQSIELSSREYSFVFQWIRGFYIVGNTRMGCSIFSKITQAEERKDKLFPFTTGENQYDFISYENFCEQVVAVIEQTEIQGIINCCSGKPQKLSERVERFIREEGYKIKLEYGAFQDRPYDSKAVWGDDKKIQSILENRNCE